MNCRIVWLVSSGRSLALHHVYAYRRGGGGRWHGCRRFVRDLPKKRVNQRPLGLHGLGNKVHRIQCTQFKEAISFIFNDSDSLHRLTLRAFWLETMTKRSSHNTQASVAGNRTEETARKQFCLGLRGQRRTMIVKVASPGVDWRILNRKHNKHYWPFRGEQKLEYGFMKDYLFTS